MKISFIIPAYNEAARIGATLRDVVEYFSAQDYAWEIIVVDDGSTDETAAVAAGEGIRVIHLERNEGKGAAVRRGMLESQGDVRIFSDADGSTPVREVAPLLTLIESGADVVIGSRALAQSDVQVHQAWPREQMGKIFNVILKCFALTPYKDTQCGFKGFTAQAAETVFSRQQIAHFSFDVELLYIARLDGLKIEEMPVTWRNAPQSTLHPITDSAKMVLDLLRIRWNAMRGLYR